MAAALNPGARRLLLVAPPLAFAVWAGLHPNPDVNAEAVMDVATWFAVFHVVQLAFVGLVAVTVLLLAADYGHADAWTTRVGIVVFLVVFSAYDAIAGIATGLAMRNARDLPAAQQDGVWETVKDWPAFDPAVFSLNVVATLGWVVAVGGVAFAARRAGAARSEWVFIALAAVFLMGGHPFPAGTIAFGCLFIAAVLHLRATARRPTLEGSGDLAPSGPEVRGPAAG